MIRLDLTYRCFLPRESEQKSDMRGSDGLWGRLFRLSIRLFAWLDILFVVTIFCFWNRVGAEGEIEIGFGTGCVVLVLVL